MTPDTKHEQYEAMEATWTKCRDTAIGARAVKAKGSTYLPRLGGQVNDSDVNYKAYKERAQFFGAVSRTIDTMTGHIFRKQPTITLPDAMEEYKADINMAGLSLEGLITDLVEDTFEVGRCGILVEYPQREDLEEGTALTVEQSRQQGLRPYIVKYKAESILNWKLGRVNNATVLMNVWLHEVEDDVEQIRELYLEDRYGQRIWRQPENGGDWEVVQTIIPTKNAKGIMEIPFFIISPKEAGADIQNPPLEGLSDTCLGYYRNSADYENALHVVGTPTPWVNGITDPDSVPDLHIGSNTFLKLPPDAQADFLQCGADGVAALKEAMQEKKAEMAAQGARMLEPDKRMAESAEAHIIKRGGENSVLASIAGSVEMSVTKALKFMAEWIGLNPDDASIELNKDYLPNPMDATMLREWNATYLSGTISYETYFQGLLSGELVPENLTAEDEQDRIGDAQPLGLINDDQ